MLHSAPAAQQASVSIFLRAHLVQVVWTECQGQRVGAAGVWGCGDSGTGVAKMGFLNDGWWRSRARFSWRMFGCGGGGPRSVNKMKISSLSSPEMDPVTAYLQARRWLL